LTNSNQLPWSEPIKGYPNVWHWIKDATEILDEIHHNCDYPLTVDDCVATLDAIAGIRARHCERVVPEHRFKRSGKWGRWIFRLHDETNEYGSLYRPSPIISGRLSATVPTIVKFSKEMKCPKLKSTA